MPDKAARNVAPMPDMDPDLEKALRAADYIFPQAYWAKFRKAFTPRALVFFEWYVELRRINLGKPLGDTDLIADYRKAARILAQVKSPVDGRPLSPIIINRLTTDRSDVFKALRKIAAGTAMSVTWRNLNEVMVSFIIEMCKDKGIYLKAIQRGTERWPIFRKMTGKQQQIEVLKDEDPTSYALIVQNRQTLAQIDEGNFRALEANGLEVEEHMVAGRPVAVGHDPVTGEHVIFDRDGTRFVGNPPTLMVDEFGDPVLVPLTKKQKALEAKGIKQPRKQRKDWEGTAERAYADHNKAKRRAIERASRVPTRTEVDPRKLRVVPDEELALLTGKVEYAAITDDKAKQGRLTRIFATKRVETLMPDPSGDDDWMVVERQVIVGDPKGRYIGCYLDDLINGQGRLIEGTAYTVGKDGEKKTAPTRIDPADREPYVSVSGMPYKRVVNGKKDEGTIKKLYIKITGDRNFTPLLTALKELACNGGKGSKVDCVESIVMSDTRYPSIDKKTGKQEISIHSGKPKFTNGRGFYFDPKDFGLIMEQLQGMALSSAAVAEVQAYYKELTLAERATEPTNLQPYTSHELEAVFPGGEHASFVTRKTSVNDDGTEEIKPFDLLKKQQQGLAWLDANGNSGVLALETGVGKTLSGVGMMMKLARDGFLEPGASFDKPDGTKVVMNGRFLFVCPKDLRGNMHKEIHKFISPAKPLADRVDVLSFREYSAAFHGKYVPPKLRKIPHWKALIAKEEARLEAGGKPRPGKGKYPKNRVWVPESYVSIIFDEAHALKNPGTQMSKAALQTYHPRKICMTASPMEKDPMDAYVLAAVCNNTPLFGKSKEAKDNRKTMRRFKKRYCAVVGGRIVGVKKEGKVVRDLHTWVKRNIYHADKTQVEEYELPALRPNTVVSEMPPQIEAAYRDLSGNISQVMQQAARKFRERGDVSATKVKEAERIFGRELKPIIKLLNLLANRPAAAFKLMADMVETGTIPGWKDKEGNPRPLPKGLAKAVAKWRKTMNPDEMRMTAAEIGNPKVETAVGHIKNVLGPELKGSRTLVFSDDKAMCLEAARYISKVVGGRHALCLAKEIHIFEGGKPLTEIGFKLDDDTAKQLPLKEKGSKKDPNAKGRLVKHSLPFKEQALRRYPELRAHKTMNRNYKANQWQQFVLQEVVSADPSVKTAILLGSSYAHGHNLQAFSTVIHLDRNSWNSEAMKQRTARAWRQGQKKGVDEITIDATYPDSREGDALAKDAEATLDDIRRVFQSMDGAIFDDIIIEAQKTELGTEWEDTTRRRSSDFRLCQNTVALMLSPHAKNSDPPDCGKR